MSKWNAIKSAYNTITSRVGWMPRASVNPINVAAHEAGTAAESAGGFIYRGVGHGGSGAAHSAEETAAAAGKSARRTGHDKKMAEAREKHDIQREGMELKHESDMMKLDLNAKGRQYEAQLGRQERLANARLDRQVAVEELQSQREMNKLKKQFAKEDQNWFQRNKIMTGIGAMGAAGLGYNMMGSTGTPVMGGGFSPEEAGAQAAMRDAMMAQAAANQNNPGMMIAANDARYEGRVAGSPSVQLG